MFYADKAELLESLKGIVRVGEHDVIVQHGEKLKQLIDPLVHNALFNPQTAVRETARWVIHAAAHYMGVLPSSLQSLYLARGRGEYLSKTVPLVSLSGVTYDMARAFFRAMKTTGCATCLFELNLQSFTAPDQCDQSPLEFSSCVLAAAIRESFHGPVFLQLGGLSYHNDRFYKNPSTENQQLRQLLRTAVQSGIYNLSIDASTLIEPSGSTGDTNWVQRQRRNFEQIAALTVALRDFEPHEIAVGLGAHMGKHNTSLGALNAFMDGYLDELKKDGPELQGLCKLEVTAHLPNSKQLDVGLLEKLRDATVSKYHLGGLVLRHLGELTLPQLHRLPQLQVLEADVSTHLYNALFESNNFPTELRQQIDDYMKDAQRSQWETGDSETQFLNKTRHRHLSPFKKALAAASSAMREAWIHDLQPTAIELIRVLGVAESTTLVRDKVRVTATQLPKRPL